MRKSLTGEVCHHLEWVWDFVMLSLPSACRSGCELSAVPATMPFSALPSWTLTLSFNKSPWSWCFVTSREKYLKHCFYPYTKKQTVGFKFKIIKSERKKNQKETKKSTIQTITQTLKSFYCWLSISYRTKVRSTGSHNVYRCLAQNSLYRPGWALNSQTCLSLPPECQVNFLTKWISTTTENILGLKMWRSRSTPMTTERTESLLFFVFEIGSLVFATV